MLHKSESIMQSENTQNVVDRLKLLYPMVNEDDTPLPRSWSSKDKYNYIGLSQNNLRVHYKGYGKTHKDAASVRTSYSIPAACGLYYFEVKIVSKGRDGYMGIGLSAHGVNVNRLPGWDKNSYGYHGDDGHSFCSSGTGQPYGPTFTTGDIIGCGVNLVDNTAFYTKNGHHLGIAFTDLPPNLYPTVGLQTPGEVVDANFGQAPFLFDISDMINELRVRTRLRIINFPSIDHGPGQWQFILHKMVSAYLIHHGYCETAQVFASCSSQVFREDLDAIKNRQKILKLILAGHMGEAIDCTNKLYPGLLDNDCNLLFALKCRQFVEMVNGTDLVSYSQECEEDFMFDSKNRISSTKDCNDFIRTPSEIKFDKPKHANGQVVSDIEMDDSISVEKFSFQGVRSDLCFTLNNATSENATTIIQSESNCANSVKSFHDSLKLNHTNQSDIHMDIDHCTKQTRKEYVNKINQKLLCGGNKIAIERMLEFGKKLHAESVSLMQHNENDEHNKKTLQDVFSLLAYSNPWISPVGWQLNPRERETVCARLNSAILESCNLPRRPPLEVAVSHAKELVRLMSNVGLGACGFAEVDNIIEY